VDFIKIDIQGAELEVCQGGVTTLAEVLAMLYRCVDVALFCCREVDLATGSSIGEEFLRRLKMAAV
jgi:hypothetical protein